MIKNDLRYRRITAVTFTILGLAAAIFVVRFFDVAQWWWLWGWQQAW